MKILGIDYGKSKVGLAIADASISEPKEVIRYKDAKILDRRIVEIVGKSNIEKVIVGVSEGEMGLESVEFAGRLKGKLYVPVETFDETLTTFDAKQLSIQAGIRRKKRKNLEDAYAASLMLQNYLDSNRT